MYGPTLSMARIHWLSMLVALSRQNQRRLKDVITAIIDQNHGSSRGGGRASGAASRVDFTETIGDGRKRRGEELSID